MVAMRRDDAAPLPGRAAEVFEFEGHAARSPLVDQVWRTRSAPDRSFISVATSHWEMVVTEQEGVARLTVFGPETRATTASSPRTPRSSAFGSAWARSCRGCRLDSSWMAH